MVALHHDRGISDKFPRPGLKQWPVYQTWICVTVMGHNSKFMICVDHNAVIMKQQNAEILKFMMIKC